MNDGQRLLDRGETLLIKLQIGEKQDEIKALEQRLTFLEYKQQRRFELFNSYHLAIIKMALENNEHVPNKDCYPDIDLLINECIAELAIKDRKAEKPKEDLKGETKWDG